MTNFFSAEPRKTAWLTPERLVLVLPVAGGALAALLLLVLALPPLVVQVKQRQGAIRTLEAQQAELPQLRVQVLERQQQVQRKLQQHQRLLGLVAGAAQLRTWISGLNDLAAATKVAVTQVEPGPLEVFTPPPAPASEGQEASVSTAPAPSSDPLLVEGLQKRSATITLKGRYEDLRRFLQRLEALEVIAIASDLDLKAAASAQQQGATAAKVDPLELKLKLSAYGRAPAAPAAPAAATP
ncbi:MAG: hypothetical protein VKL97_05035 [Cyanobacteriota bacterium]|nr:hypothetical protein [Cyanobacteriota bacterium]